MVKACGADAAADVNPGVLLGAILGTAANHGRDKVTIIASPGIQDLGAWLEQLLAESTGKIGKGIVPIDRETLAKPAIYGNDRVFAYLRLQTKPNKAQDAAVAAPACARCPNDSRRSPRRPHLAPKHLQSRPGIFPLGDRHCRRRRHHRHQRLQSTGRRSQQDRNQETHQRVRRKGKTSAGGPVLRGQRHQALRRREKRRRAQRRLNPHRRPASASGPNQSRRLFRRARLHHHE